MLRDLGGYVVIDLILHCPACGMQHIDAPERDTHAPCSHCKAVPAVPCYDWCKAWRNEPHRSHLCKGCGHIWRPSDTHTNGVASIRSKGVNDSERVRPVQYVGVGARWERPE